MTRDEARNTERAGRHRAAAVGLFAIAGAVVAAALLNAVTLLVDLGQAGGSAAAFERTAGLATLVSSALLLVVATWIGVRARRRHRGK